MGQPKELYRDRLVTFKSVVLFSVLTVLNISVFVFMIFENQMELIARNAELESKDKGVTIKIQAEKILTGLGTNYGGRRYNTKASAVPVYREKNSYKGMLDRLEKGETVFSEYQQGSWHWVVYRNSKSGWIEGRHLKIHVPAWQKCQLGAEDIRLILNELEKRKISEYTVFLEDGTILAESGKNPRKTASEQEKRMIKKAIFKNAFENYSFYHQVNREQQTVELYIPIYYCSDKMFVLKPSIPTAYIWTQTQLLYRQILIVGVLILMVHFLFVFINQRIIIRPMVQERTDILQEKNEQIQEAYDGLNKAHSVIQSELDVAREIQLALIPAKLPDLDGYTFTAHYQPADKVGGDFYDFFPIDDEHLGFIIADASGHGVPAAFVVSMAKMAFDIFAKGQRSSSEMIVQSNAVLTRTIKTFHLVTAIYMVLHIPSGKVTFTRAGHPPAALYRKRSQEVERMDVKGLVLGMNEVPYTEGSIIMEPGDRIMLFTDGISEAANNKKEMYGRDRMDLVLQEQGTQSGKIIAEKIFSEVENFKGEMPYNDDVTLLILEKS